MIQTKTVAYWLIEFWVLRVVQFWFNYPVYFLKRVWNYLDKYHVSIDNYHSMENVALTRSVSYGSHPREKFHVLTPTLHTNIRGNIFYVHGGGFVASCREMYYNSFTYLVRRGFRVFVVDYPHPTMSMLRCLNYMATNSKWKVKEVHLVGDSAGANLIFLATSIVLNKKIQQDFLSKFNSTTSSACSTFLYPKLLSCLSIYGMIDRKMGSKASFPMGLGLNYLWKCVSNYETNPNCNLKIFPISFYDLLERYSLSPSHTNEREKKNGIKVPLKFPPTQFAVGDIDPLLHDSIHVHQRMKDDGIGYSEDGPPKINIYKGGFHGFFGLPPEWQPFNAWKSAALPCSEDVYQFLSKHAKEPRNETIPLNGSRVIGFDWYGIIVIHQLAVVLPIVIVAVPLCLLYIAVYYSFYL
jgi:acetyl esterase/lipase